MKILVKVNLSESTKKIVRRPKKSLNHFQILHIAEPEPDFVGFDAGPQSERDFLAKRFHDKRRQIEEIADQLRKVGLDTTARLAQGATVETILNAASRNSM